MATTLTVLLAGVNKTSPVVKQVQKDIEKLGGTVSVFNKKQQRETKETTQGFEKVAHVLKGFGGVAREAAEGGGLLGRALGLFGVGGIAGAAVAGLGAAAAGALTLAENYADTAQSLRRTSEASGFTKDAINLVGAGAKRAGVDMRATQSSLVNFSQALYLAANRGVNATEFTKLGINLDAVRSKTLSTKDAFYEYADALRQQVDPNTQNLLAQAAGLQDLLPAIRQNILALEDAAKKSGDVMGHDATEGAEKLDQQIKALHGAVDALGVSFEELTVGPLTHFVTTLEKALMWTESLPEKLKGAFQEYEDAYKQKGPQGLLDVLHENAKRDEEHAKAREEEKRARHGGPSVVEQEYGPGAVSVPIPGAAPATGDGSASKSFSDRLAAIKGAADKGATAGLSGDIEKFMALGWSREQAEGLVSQEPRESGGKPDKWGDSGEAYGKFQWHKERRDAYKKLTGRDLVGSSGDEQLAFADYELREGGEKSAGDLLKAQTTPGGSGAVAARYYERPKDVEGAVSYSATVAQRLDDQMRAGEASRLDKMQLDIQMSNVQPGTEVTARDGNGRNIPVRVSPSMDPGLVTGW